MAWLTQAADELLTLLTSSWQLRDLDAALQAVLVANPDAAPGERDAVLIALAAAVRQQGLHGAAAAAVAAGALVETGATPDALADALLPRLVEALHEPHGPREGAGDPAWTPVPSLCIAAISVLTRHPRIRRIYATEPELTTAHPRGFEVAFLHTVLALLDDSPLDVVHPGSGATHRVQIDQIPTIRDLHVLLADLLVGGGLLPGQAPPAAARATLEGHGPRQGPTVAGWWQLPDAGMAPPRDLPQRDGVRRIELIDLEAPAPFPVIRQFDGLRPSVRRG